MTKTIVYVPAKYHSKRILNKNLQILDGEYLFKRKLLQLLACKEIDEVWLDSESDILHNLVSDLPIKHLYRPKKFASNNYDGHQMFEWQTKNSSADIVCQALCTAPFLDTLTIDTMIRRLKQSRKKSLVCVTKEKKYFWENNNPVYGKTIPNSINLKDSIFETMSFYAVKANNKVCKKRYTSNPILYELNPLESMDINNNFDLDLANKISNGMRMKKYSYFKSLANIISSALLSDICKDLKINHYLGSSIKLLNSGTFLGYAKTLKLKKINSNLKNRYGWKGIYKALDSYNFIVPGDVIVVSNPTEKAYFGDLNATYAYKSGAIGVVIDGYTRDVEAVSKVGLPVFGYGSKPDDIRFEGTLEHMNKSIKINNVNIKNNDIIFGDQDGVVAIPQEKWPVIQSKLKQNVKKEMLVKLEATFGMSSKKVLKKIGLF